MGRDNGGRGDEGMGVRCVGEWVGGSGRGSGTRKGQARDKHGTRRGQARDRLGTGQGHVRDRLGTGQGHARDRLGTR